MVERRVVLVVGPPGSGKSTYAAALGLRHLEAEWFHSDADFRAAARRVGDDPAAQAVVVRCCPRPAERDEWVRLVDATETVVLTVPFKECAKRIQVRHRPAWKSEIMAAKQWWAQWNDPASVTVSTSRDW